MLIMDVVSPIDEVDKTVVATPVVIGALVVVAIIVGVVLFISLKKSKKEV